MQKIFPPIKTETLTLIYHLIKVAK